MRVWRLLRAGGLLLCFRGLLLCERTPLQQHSAGGDGSLNILTTTLTRWARHGCACTPLRLDNTHSYAQRSGYLLMWHYRR